MSDVAGYRPLRVLARGDRAELLLAALDEERVVIKRYPEQHPAGDLLRELEALERAAGDGVVAIRDLGSDGWRACLVLEHSPGGDLARLLGRDEDADSEALPALVAALGSTVARLHRAGVAHGALAPRHVVLSAGGDPVLVGFGAAELFAPGAPEVLLETIEAVASDRAGLRAIAAALLARITDAARRRDLLAELASLSDPDLATGLAQLGRGPATGPAGADAWQRLEAARRPITLAAPPPVEFPDEPPNVRRRLIEAVLDRAPGELIPALRERWSAASTGRRRVVVAGLAVAAVLVLSFAVLPVDGATNAAPQASPTTLDRATVSEATRDPAVAGDDPVAAAAVLLASMAECMRLASVLCLDGVVQPGSSAERELREAVRAGDAESVAPQSSTDELVLVDRLGDSALVALGTPETRPASLLLVKGEAGWRVRDVLDAPPSD